VKDPGLPLGRTHDETSRSYVSFRHISVDVIRNNILCP